MFPHTGHPWEEWNGAMLVFWVYRPETEAPYRSTLKKTQCCVAFIWSLGFFSGRALLYYSFDLFLLNLFA